MVCQDSPTNLIYYFFSQRVPLYYNLSLVADVEKHGSQLRQRCNQLGRFSQHGGGKLLLIEVTAGVLAFIKDSLQMR